MMIKRIDTPQRKPGFFSAEAHDKLPELAQLLKQEKGVHITYTEAASLAILDMTLRLQRRAARRQEREQKGQA